MSHTPSKTPAKGSKRLILKITSLSLASLFAFGVIAFVSFTNYKSYNDLLAEQQQLTQKSSTLTTLQQTLLSFQEHIKRPLSLASFVPTHQIIADAEKIFSKLKAVDNPLLTQAFSQFLDIKKQTKILKSFLAKQKVLSKQTSVAKNKIAWIHAQSHSQQKKILNDLPSLIKKVSSLRDAHKKDLQTHNDILKSFESTTLNHLYMILVFLAMGIILIHFFAAYLISKPLAQITKRMRDINDGNISDEIHGTDRKDEFGDIARMLHVFKENAMKIEKMQKHLQLTIEESKKSSQIKNQFMTRMSHELRTPLNAIIGYSEMIVDSVDDKMDLQQLRTDINQIANAGQNLLVMVDSVLELTDESENNVVKPENFNVREEVQQVLPALEVVILKNKNKFKVHCPDASLMMDSDPKKVTKILINLIKNAADFTKSGQLVLDIAAAHLGDLEAICFKIKDTGCGIESSRIPGLFSAFEQSTTGSIQENKGLGLAIVKKITDELHGQISVDSVINQGSTFTLILPCNHNESHQRAKNLLISPLADAV